MKNNHSTTTQQSFRDGLFSGHPGRIVDISAALCDRAHNLGSCLGIPFIPQIAIDKFEVVIALRFPVIRDTEDIYEHMKALAHTASGCRSYDPTRSLLHGETTPRGFHEDLEPPRNPEFRRIRKAKTSMHIQCRKQDRSFPSLVQPMLPGQFSRFWPAASRTNLPQALHTCRRIQLDWVEEIPVDKAFTPWTYLEAVFTLDLNVNRALAHHPFMTQPKLSDEQIATAFFPNPKVKQSTVDNFCAPELPQEGIIQALENTIHVQMSILYADLVRALAEVPDFPLIKAPASTWKEAFSWSKLSSLEVNRHLKVDDAPRTVRAMELPFQISIRKYRTRYHALEEEGSSRHPAFDNEPMSIGGILRQGSKGKKIPGVAAKIYPKGMCFIRMELRFCGYEGLCCDMPKDSSRSIMASFPEGLVDIILRVCFYSQRSFDRLLVKLPTIKTPDVEELASFCRQLRTECSESENKIILERIISRIKSRFALDMSLIDDPEMDRLLRRLTNKGLFIRKGSTSAPRYFPNFK